GCRNQITIVEGVAKDGRKLSVDFLLRHAVAPAIGPSLIEQARDDQARQSRSMPGQTTSLRRSGPFIRKVFGQFPAQPIGERDRAVSIEMGGETSRRLSG